VSLKFDSEQVVSTTVKVPRQLQWDAVTAGREIGLYTWQDVARHAVEAWLESRRTAQPLDEPADPRLARVVRYLSQPGNLDRLEHLLRAIVQSP
jgi:hypothetical protein